MWGSQDLSVNETLNTIAASIVKMFREGWFDDAVGLVEGFEIFRQLMEHGMFIWISSHSTHHSYV